MISDGKIWIEALESRNEMAHTYDEALSKAAERKIRMSYAPILRDIYAYLRKQNKVDVIGYSLISNMDLKKHIDHEGKVIYKRGKSVQSSESSI